MPSHLAPRIVDGFEVIPLCDAVGPMGAVLQRPFPELFPGSRPEDFAQPDPGEWLLHFHCFLLRDPAGRTTLVDTGIGGPDSAAAQWAPVPGALGSELARVGVTAEEVDTVVITHLHSDHSGGAVVAGRPVFGNARYVLQRAEVDWVPAQVTEEVVRPLGDQLQVVEGDTELLPGIRVILAPGHTPGHQVVQVGDTTITGDLVLHEVQVAAPEITYRYDTDPELAAKTRAAVLEQVRGRRGSIATAHFPEPFTAL